MANKSALFSRKQSGGAFVFTDETHGTGNIFFVHSGTGTDAAGGGFNPDAPLATIDYAIGLCTASQGDKIIVMPGHAETIIAAGGITADKAGISIIGLGNGNNRPTITFGTDAAATLLVSAANVRLSNLLFLNDIDEQVLMIGVTGAACTIENCDFYEGSSKQWLIAVNVGTGADRCTIRNCYFQSVTAAAAANSAITIAAAVDRCVIEDNEVFGDFGNACIHNPTGNVATLVSIKRNILTNLNSGDHAIELVSACTGIIAYNAVNSTLAAVGTKTAIDPGSCYCIENYGSDGVGDVSGVINPALDA